MNRRGMFGMLASLAMIVVSGAASPGSELKAKKACCCDSACVCPVCECDSVAVKTASDRG